MAIGTRGCVLCPLLTPRLTETDPPRVIDQGELREAFMALASQVPEPYELAGVTYHGPEAGCEWIAFLLDKAAGTTGGPEGCGATPLAALADLHSHLSELEVG